MPLAGGLVDNLVVVPDRGNVGFDIKMCLLTAGGRVGWVGTWPSVTPSEMGGRAVNRAVRPRNDTALLTIAFIRVARLPYEFN